MLSAEQVWHTPTSARNQHQSKQHSSLSEMLKRRKSIASGKNSESSKSLSSNEKGGRNAKFSTRLDIKVEPEPCKLGMVAGLPSCTQTQQNIRQKELSQQSRLLHGTKQRPNRGRRVSHRCGDDSIRNKNESW